MIDLTPPLSLFEFLFSSSGLPPTGNGNGNGNELAESKTKNTNSPIRAV